ncbi:DUF4240 domain-containing protein [Marinifilum fragile]|uniref:DUF4240 domain-containing protein n=1 Tax=Marinifilum fragile TaxID=570161 RepID=UPI002AAAF67A|nr:DUF4240 domain-containing protein [Marinifilum fragile]
MRIILPTIATLLILSCTNNKNTNMGILDKIFGKDSNKSKIETKFVQVALELDKTAELLNEDLYWEIIDQSLRNTNHQDAQEQFLIEEIAKLTPKEMVGFRLRTDMFLYETYNSEMWCAGYIMNGGCSDDGFEYFRNWVISRGKETYYKAKENPDYLIKEVVANDDFYEFESFWYVALEAFQQKTGKNLYDYIDYDNFKMGEGNYQNFEFTWDEENPESMKKICPKLFEKMWN